MSAVKECSIGAGCAEGSVARVVGSYDRYFDWCVRGGHSEIPTLSQFVGDSGIYRQWSVVGNAGLCVGSRALLLDDVVVGSEVPGVRDSVHAVGGDGVSGACVDSDVSARTGVEAVAEVSVGPNGGVSVGKGKNYLSGSVDVSVGKGLVGPNGGKSFGRGGNYQRNQAAREARKKRKREKKESTYTTTGLVGSGLRAEGLSGPVVKSELQQSLEAKWKAENQLAVKQAERKMQLLDARDLEAEKRMQRAQIMRTTESAKVQTERAYATLKRTGNVPGFAETVVTDGSCPELSPSRSDGTCISPDSSVSQQEIRAMMKELEDYKLTMSRIERDNPALVAHHMEGHGVKTAFTLDSDGLCPVDEPGSMGEDGKYHLDSYEPNPRFYKDRFRAEEFAEKYFGS